MTSDELDRKMKLERFEVCLNCENIGKFDECEDFVEDELDDKEKLKSSTHI
jgi:hypothetical protein